MAEKTKPVKLSSKEVNPTKFIELNPTIQSGGKKTTAVLTMGDFSSPNSADHRLVEYMATYANAENSDPFVFIVRENIDEEHYRIPKNVFGDIVHENVVENMEEALSILLDNYANITVISPGVNLIEMREVSGRIASGSIQVIEYADPEIRRSALDSQLHEKIHPLSYSERIRRAQTMKRYARRMEIARERAENRRATPEKIRERARRRALEIIRARITSNKNYAELSNIEKNAVDMRLMGIPASVIERIARKLIPVVKRAEADKFNRKHHHVSLSASSTGHAGHINESFESMFEQAFILTQEEDQTIPNIFALIEAVETSHLDRARDAIKNEKRTDAIKHQKMITTAKHADINRKAAARFAELRKESSDVIQNIIDRELERKKLLSAVRDFSDTPDISYISGKSKEDEAKAAAIKSNLKGYDYNDILRLYKAAAAGKVSTQNFKAFDVTESENNTPAQREWGTDSLTDIYKDQTPGQSMEEGSKGLWYNIRQRRKKGLRRLRPGEKGYPETLDIEDGK